jgi:hypothetical protein
MTTIEEAAQSAIEQAAPNATVTVVPAPAPAVPPHVAANICEMLKRVQVTGMESLAWIEAYQLMQKFAAPPPQGPGAPVKGLGG